MSETSVMVFGCSPVGLGVAKGLAAAGHEFCLADGDKAAVEAAIDQGLPAILLDYSNDADLRAAGIGKTVKTLFCLFSEEYQNLFLILSARALDPTLSIIGLCDSRASAHKLVAAGANRTLDPHEMMGCWISDMIHRPHVYEVLRHTLFGDVDLNLAEIPITGESGILGRSLDALGLEGYGLIVLGVVDAGPDTQLLFRFSYDTRSVVAGDSLVVLGPIDEIERLRADLNAP